MLVSLVIPAHNEEDNIEVLVKELIERLRENNINMEIIIVNDNSKDKTGEKAERLAEFYPFIRVVHRKPPAGFGRAIKDGFKVARGNLLIPVMGDLSDDPEDVLKLIKKAEEGYDVVYGSRFIEGGMIEDYPLLKLLANRCFNNLVRLAFGIKHRDITNAFKAYRKEVIEKIGIDNLESNHFDLTVELPLKAHILGFSSVEVPVTWHGRTSGVSKLKLTRMGHLYIKRLLSIFLRVIKSESFLRYQK